MRFPSLSVLYKSYPALACWTNRLGMYCVVSSPFAGSPLPRKCVTSLPACDSGSTPNCPDASTPTDGQSGRFGVVARLSPGCGSHIAMLRSSCSDAAEEADAFVLAVSGEEGPEINATLSPPWRLFSVSSFHGYLPYHFSCVIDRNA